MSAPTLGITILIILGFTILSQLLIQRSEHRKRHRELNERMDRLEKLLKP